MTIQRDTGLRSLSGVGRSERPRSLPGLSTTSHATVSTRLLPLTCTLVDLALIGLVLVVSAALRRSMPFETTADDLQEVALQVWPVIVGAWLVFLGLLGSYDSHRLDSGTEVYKSVLNASLLAAGAVGIWCYLGQVPLSRGFFMITFVLGVPTLALGRLGLRRTLHRLRSHGHLPHRVIIAGDPAHVDDLAAVLRRERWLGYHVVGALAPEHDPSGRSDVPATPGGVAYLGSVDRAWELATSGDADSLIVTAGAYTSASGLRRAQWDLEDHRVQVIVAPDVTDIAAERVTVRPVAGLPLVHLERPARQQALRGAKRAFDVLAAGALLLLTAPLLAVAAWQVHRHDGGPVLFRQRRTGQDGATFSMVKLRTMVTGAESLVPGPGLRSPAAGDPGNAVMFKMVDDPRVTRPGRWLRRFSVDEIPQLLNVLRGEMSLVGPRPALPSEVQRYDGDAVRRLRVRPGLTGLWQVSGRSDLSWEDTVRLDLYYVDNWSMVQDLIILARTVRAVTTSSGAY